VCVQNIRNDILNPIIDRNEEMLASMGPGEHLVIFSLEFDQNLFRRSQGTIIDQFVETIPNTGKNVRRIVPAPTIQDCTRIDAVSHELSRQRCGLFDVMQMFELNV